MTVRRGKKHRYLGMDMDWSVKGQIMIHMSEYNKETVSMCPESLEKPVKAPAGEHSLKVNVDCAKLDKKRARLFHTLTARNLFVSKRARGDILPTTAFFTTRVKEPDEDGWKNFGRCLQYLKDTVNDVLILIADNICVVKWWVDGLYACHEDCRSQTGEPCPWDEVQYIAPLKNKNKYKEFNGDRGGFN